MGTLANARLAPALESVIQDGVSRGGAL